MYHPHHQLGLRQLFLRHLAPTSPEPLALHIVKAEGTHLWDAEGHAYLDLIGGISVANTGHRHPKVLQGIEAQLDAYLHVMVYGELVQSPQVRYATALTESLPPSLNSVYFTNSGAEAVEGAMKLAKRCTGRTGIAAFHFSYHGSTQGALSLLGSEYWRNAYRPLLPGIDHLTYNSIPDLQRIDGHTAAVVAETVQAEAGLIAPHPDWLKALRDRCAETGALLILDEIQAGFGRTGKTWGFEHFGILPDVLLLGKALGGGLPLGAFIADRALMAQLADHPVLGHITTFGGHPLSCAAGLAAFEVLHDERLAEAIPAKERILRDRLRHPAIKALHTFGLWAALHLDSFETCKKVMAHCIRKGLMIDWFLFASHALRISPPLTISEADLDKACGIILESLEENR